MCNGESWEASRSELLDSILAVVRLTSTYQSCCISFLCVLYFVSNSVQKNPLEFLTGMIIIQVRKQRMKIIQIEWRVPHTCEKQSVWVVQWSELRERNKQ